MHTQKMKTTRSLSKQEVSNYFIPRRYPLWTGILIVIGIILIIVGLIVPNMISIVIGLFLELWGWSWIYSIKRANPNDAQYDAWVEKQGQILYRRGLQALGITKSQMSNPVIRIQSYVIPGSHEAKEYLAEDVKMKHGKDGDLRFSINVFTYIYPTTRSLAIFRGDINAFTPSHYNDLHEVYPYHHIVTATTSPLRDNIIINGENFIYRTEQLCLKISNGETIPLSATVKMGPLGSAPDVPRITLPETGFTRALHKLRQVLLP